MLNPPHVTLRRHRVMAPTRIFALLLLVLGTTVVACGKRGDPVAPEDVTLTYPRDYPTEP